MQIPVAGAAQFKTREHLRGDPLLPEHVFNVTCTASPQTPADTTLMQQPDSEVWATKITATDSTQRRV